MDIMHSIHRDRWGTRLASWGVLLVIACTSGGCIISADFGVSGYPAELGVSLDPAIVVWQADPEGTNFGSIATPATESVSEQDRCVDFEWPSDLALVLPGRIGSVSVLLDPNPSAELRARVRELLAEIERVNPQVITSVTVCVQSVGEIDDGKQFIAAMQRLSNAAFEQRYNSSMRPLVQLDWPFSSWPQASSRIVLPNASVPGEYFLAVGTFNGFQEPLHEDAQIEIRSVGPNGVLEQLDDTEVVVFIEPMNTPFEVMEAMRELMQQATSQPKPGDYVKARWATWPLLHSEFTDAASVRLALQGRLGDCTRPCCAASAQP